MPLGGSARLSATFVCWVFMQDYRRTAGWLAHALHETQDHFNISKNLIFKLQAAGRIYCFGWTEREVNTGMARWYPLKR